MTARLESWTPEEYRAAKGYVSRGAIKDALASWSVYRGRQDGTVDADPTGAAAKLGSAGHDAVLRPSMFESTYIVAPSWDPPTSAEGEDERKPDEWDSRIAIRPAFRGKGAKDARAVWEHLQQVEGKVSTSRTDYAKTKRDLWRAEHKDAIEITEREHMLCLGMQTAVFAHETAAMYATRGSNEQALAWEDPETGLKCKALLDMLVDERFSADLKTTNDPSPSAFTKTAARDLLHLQDAFYTLGLSVLHGVPWHEIPPMTFVVVRSTPPHEVGLYALGFAERNAGITIVRSALDQIAARSREGRWSNDWERTTEPMLLTFPDYALGNPLEPSP